MDTLDYLRRPKRTAPRPVNWSYSNTNHTLLGLIIERRTQQTAESEVRRRILEPLGMDHTFFDGFELQRHGTMAGRYHYESPRFRETADICGAFPTVQKEVIDVSSSNLSVSWAAGGMISHPADLVKFAIGLRDGKLLKPDSMKAMQEWIPATIHRHKMGRGIFRQEIEGRGAWLGHSGGVLGFSA